MSKLCHLELLAKNIHYLYSTALYMCMCTLEERVRARVFGQKDDSACQIRRRYCIHKLLRPSRTAF